MESVVESSIKITNNTDYELNLQKLLNQWDADYHSLVIDIELFDPIKTRSWSSERLKYFVKVFYHSRGHFRDFLWHLGNFAPNKHIKAIILENIAEEFNGDCLSHEQLYLDFARQVGVDLSQEIINEEYYTKEMRDFNQIHIKWIFSHNWASNLALFSAYERLDTIDYQLLSSLTEKEHPFFTIHRKAKHFDKTYNTLLEIWSENSNTVVEAFDFIATTQAKMWKDLSDDVFNFTTA